MTATCWHGSWGQDKSVARLIRKTFKDSIRKWEKVWFSHPLFTETEIWGAGDHRSNYAEHQPTHGMGGPWECSLVFFCLRSSWRYGVCGCVLWGYNSFPLHSRSAQELLASGAAHLNALLLIGLHSSCHLCCSLERKNRGGCSSFTSILPLLLHSPIPFQIQTVAQVS